jgi:thioesterase domain-containing protein
MIDAILPERGMRYRVEQFARLCALPLHEIVRVAANSVWRRVAAVFGSEPKSEFSLQVAEEKIAAIDDLRQAAYARAAERYVGEIRPLQGNIELIVAGRRLARSPLQAVDCGWHRVLPSLKPRVIDAEHIGLVEAPNVKRVAEIFLEGLALAQGEGALAQPVINSPDPFLASPSTFQASEDKHREWSNA